MSDIRRLTITLTAELAEDVRVAVAGGEYASSSEVVREALRYWRYKRQLQDRRLADLRQDIDAGLDDIEAGRVRNFDAERIIAEGERRLAGRSSSK